MRPFANPPPPPPSFNPVGDVLTTMLAKDSDKGLVACGSTSVLASGEESNT
jgi:hypothetical protein